MPAHLRDTAEATAEGKLVEKRRRIAVLSKTKVIPAFPSYSLSRSGSVRLGKEVSYLF